MSEPKMTLREAWSLLPPKWKRLVHILWPSWIGVACSLFIMPGYQIGGHWWAVGFGIGGLVFDLTTFWRIRPLLSETFKTLDDLKT